MNQEQLLGYAERAVRQALEGDASGHGWDHIDRVRKLAMRIALTEPDADLFVVGMAALLHDIADYKFHGGDETAGSRVARAHLTEWGVEEDYIARICTVIAEVSFKGAGVDTTPSSIEGAIVQDADRLDALGAVGIYRVIAYGIAVGRTFYDPAIEPVLHQDSESYKNHVGTTVNHFYEKLLLLEKRMNTEAGYEIAVSRTQFMRLFLDHLKAEWEGGR